MKTSIRTVLPFPSILAPEILPASDRELRPRRSSGVHLAYTDPSGERQRAPSTPRWGPFSLQRSFRRAISSSAHTCFQEREHSFFKTKKIKVGGIELTSRGLLNVPTGPLRHGASTMLHHTLDCLHWATAPRCQYYMLQRTFEFLYLTEGKEKQKNEEHSFYKTQTHRATHRERVRRVEDVRLRTICSRA